MKYGAINYIIIHTGKILSSTILQGDKMKKRLLIGIICDEPHMYRSSEVIRGIAAQAFRCSCDVAVLSSMYHQQHETLHTKSARDIYNLILADIFDGFIFDRKYIYSPELVKNIEKLLVNSGKPVVIPDDIPHSIFDNTAFDDSAGFETVTSHLITEHGCRKIYCLTGRKSAANAEQRLQGYKNAMENHGLPYDESWCIYGDYWENSAIQLAEEIASGKREKPDAVVCGNDYTATKLIFELNKHGIRVPEDTAVCGFDSEPSRPDVYHLEITSYIRENFQIGCEAFRSLFRMITGKLCRKIKCKNIGLYTGKTCGCSGRQKVYMDNRETRVTMNNERDILNNDYYMQIATCSNMEETAETINKMLYRIRNLSSFSICLTEEFWNMINISSDVKLKLQADQNMIMQYRYSSDGSAEICEKKFSSASLHPDFLSEKSKPSLYYFTPLNFNDNFFGYAALSFGKTIRSYHGSYVNIISCLCKSLEHYRQISVYDTLIRHFAAEKISGMPYITSQDIINDHPVFRNRTGTKYINIFEFISGRTAMSKLKFDEFSEYIREFSKQLMHETKHDEICGCIYSSVYCIVTMNPNRTEEIFRNLSDYFSVHRMSEKYGIGLSFRASCTATGDPSEFNENVRQAIINSETEYSEKYSDSSNRLFEQFCRLRTEIESNPEKEWHIETICRQLGVSTSHFHKKYKSFFGKNLFDELITMRIRKAENLLAETDLTVGTISEMCGYSSYCYFTKQFKKTNGISPSDYRQQSKAV